MTVASMQMADMKVWAQRVLAGVDAAPDLEFAEHVFDPVALAVEGPVVRDMKLSIGL